MWTYGQYITIDFLLSVQNSDEFCRLSNPFDFPRWQFIFCCTFWIVYVWHGSIIFAIHHRYHTTKSSIICTDNILVANSTSCGLSIGGAAWRVDEFWTRQTTIWHNCLFTSYVLFSCKYQQFNLISKQKIAIS